MSENLNLTATLATQSIEYKIREAEQLIQQELEQAQGDVCVTNSFQAEDMIVLHLVRHDLPDVPVIFLDTGYHFAEVYEYRDRMAHAWSMNLINLVPELTVPEQEAQFGILNQTDPSRCCGLRKVKPLFAALNVEIAAPPTVMKEKHLRLTARQNGRLLTLKAWNFADRAAELAPGARVDIAFALEEDAYSAARGYPGWCAVLRDVRSAR